MPQCAQGAHKQGARPVLIMAEVAAEAPSQGRALRPEPYMGVFRRFRMKSDDAWTLGIQWGSSLVIVLFVIFLVMGCYFALPKPLSVSEAGAHKFSEERYVSRLLCEL